MAIDQGNRGNQRVRICRPWRREEEPAGNRSKIVKALALAVVLIISAAIAILSPGLPHRNVDPSAIHISSDSIEKTPRVCVSYPHALAKCGVASSTEFETLRDDLFVREHYSEIGMVHPAVLTADEWDFASFRGTNGIVWTPTRILVRAGELVFRDRSGNTVRARCGNRLSQERQVPVAFVMPPEMEHETPEITFVEPPLMIGWQGKPDDFLAPALSSELPFGGALVIPPSLPIADSPVTLAGLPFTYSPVTPPFLPMLPPAIIALPTINPAPVIFTPLNPAIVPVSNAPEPNTYLLALAAVAALLISKRKYWTPWRGFGNSVKCCRVVAK